MRRWLVTIACLLALAAGLWLFRRLVPAGPGPTSAPAVPAPAAPPTDRGGTQERGGEGAARPGSQGGREAGTAADASAAGEPAHGSPAGPATHADAGVETRGDQASVLEAISTHRHPERLTPRAKPAPFDLEAYARDPEAWLKVVEPGRVFLTARPGPGVPGISCVGSDAVAIGAAATAELAVRVPPGAPVTFHAFDYGRFANGLATLSVAADAEGVARVVFLAPAGTVGNGHVMAACPLTTGRVTFLVTPRE